MDIAERIIITDIQKGIHSGMAIDGGSLPMNDPKTIKRKGDNRPLIDTGTLLGEFIARNKGKGSVMVTIGPERLDIAGYLQIDGIKTNQGLKFYKFFGISKDAEDLSIEYMQDKIQKAIDNAGQ
jgi:hypothetical protein